MWAANAVGTFLWNQKVISCLDINIQITHFNPFAVRPMESSELWNKGVRHQQQQLGKKNRGHMWVYNAAQKY